MNILMIGDSWGVPNYYGSPGAAPECHTEYILRSYGYTVYNCSLNGSGNIPGIHRAKEFLSGNPIPHPAGGPANLPELVIDRVNPKIDWVVWFHTEFYRDYDPKGLYFKESIEAFAKDTYSKMSEFFKELGAKIVVIGGQAPVHHTLYKYIKVDYIIEDWRSTISGRLLPKVYTFRSVDWVQNLADDNDTKLEILNTHYLLHEVMGGNNPDFPDRCHPGARPHKELSVKLNELFKNSK